MNPSPKSFSHDFTKIEHDSEFPDNMNLKEVKQVDAIHGLLTMSLEGVGDDGHGLTKNHLPNLCFHLRGDYQAKI